jgi:Peptidase family M48
MLKIHRFNDYFILPIFVAFLFNTFSINAQNSTNYTPLSDNPQTKAAAMMELNNRYKTILQNLPADYKDKYKELYKDMQKEKTKHIENAAYLFNDTIQRYFSAILTEIKRGNPSLPLDNIQFYVSRDYSPNAATSLDGSIAFNLGLVAHCKNESQIAFIICHELAHYQLKHPARSVRKMFDFLYSKEGQNTIKEIARSEFNTYERATQYLQTAVYDSRRHGREYEEQADSLALKFMLNTRYNPQESASCLLMLDQIDSVMFVPNFDLIKVFDTPSYKFKKSWIEEEETMFGNGKRVFDGEFNKDSLKTHPSCTLRAGLLSSFLKNNAPKSNATTIQTETSFDAIQLKAEFETLVAAFDFDNVDYALFQALKSLQSKPNNIFLNAFVGQCLNAVYDGQKQHKLSKIVSIPSKNKPKDYQPFLRFLNNMSLSEIAAVNFFYLDKQDKSFLKDEFFLFNSIVAAKNANKTEALKSQKALYMTSFPKGDYVEIVSKY